MKRTNSRHLLKQELKKAFESPTPLSKDKFLKKIPPSRISNSAFLLQQAYYIPKWVWVLSIIVFAIAFLNNCFTANNTLWIVSIFLPFVALSAIVENNKSTNYKMAELEASTRFSLKSVILARQGIIGFSHLLLICLLSPLAGSNNLITILQTDVYLLVPYLMTTSLGLICTRKFHGKESISLCMGIAVIVSTICLFTQIEFPIYYQKEYFLWWISLLFILLIITLTGYYYTIQKTEDLSWNFS